VLDRGFLLGDGVYEVIPVYAGKLFRLQQHLERLQHSLDGIRFDNPHTAAEWDVILNELVARNTAGAGSDQSLYLQVTRGVAPRRDHAFPNTSTPTVFAMSTALAPVDMKQLEQGIDVITLEDIRWKHCNIKAITLLANVLARQEALDSGAHDAILIRDGEANEGAASNLFIVSNGVIRTPPKGSKLLPGITRDLILELIQANQLPYEEATITETDLAQADEIWLTSSTKEILPVTSLNGQKVGNGKAGEQWRRMITIYQAFKQSLRAGQGH
jgi:D-alanine transaminase